MTLTPRLLFLAMFLSCAGLLGYGYYLQFALYQEPCPMCIFQRFAFMGIAAIALFGALHGPGALGTRVYAAGTGLAALVGGGIAARQTWLQHLPPDQVPECGPGLEFMLEMYPLAEVIRKAFAGTGECAEVGWTFLGLSIAEWALLWFIALAAASARLLWRPAVKAA